MQYQGPNSQWVTSDPLPEGRIMGELTHLCVATERSDAECAVLTARSSSPMASARARQATVRNCAPSSTLTRPGWSPQWIANQQGYGSNPILMPAIYDPRKPAGSRWSRDGLQPAQFQRMYHSSAMLLPDGSVLIAGCVVVFKRTR